VPVTVMAISSNIAATRCLNIPITNPPKIVKCDSENVKLIK
jgi:hypothetical protein